MFDIEKVIKDTVHTDWKDILLDIVQAYKNSINEEISKDCNIMPSRENMFRCFNFVNIHDIKVIILGQDPYHTPGVADGLCFSTHDTHSINRTPPSLMNIFKELQRTHGKSRKNTNLEDLARQGVLLMNTSFSVIIHKPNSHKKIWRSFTIDILRWMRCNIRNTCIMLWGNDAIQLGKIMCDTDNLVLTHTHPSPLSRKPFVGCNHFIECDRYLESKNKDKIVWIE